MICMVLSCGCCREWGCRSWEKRCLNSCAGVVLLLVMRMITTMIGWFLRKSCPDDHNYVVDGRDDFAGIMLVG